MTTDPWVLPDSIRTERLLLRPHRPDDVDDLLVFHSDPEIVRFVPWQVRTRDEVVTFIEGRMQLLAASADGSWVVYAIELVDPDVLDDGEGYVVGEVLLKRADAANGIAELGYAIAAHVHGRGIASEAVAAMLELGRTTFGVREVHAIVDERNAPSIRLLERFGFVLDGPYPDEIEDQLMLYVLRLAP
jgi:RimJ/RimL family protein N-acetyltransferase